MHSPGVRRGEREVLKSNSTFVVLNCIKKKISLTAISRVQGSGSTFAVGEKKSMFTCFG